MPIEHAFGVLLQTHDLRREHVLLLPRNHELRRQEILGTARSEDEAARKNDDRREIFHTAGY